jgi:hypothetical protein
MQGWQQQPQQQHQAALHYCSKPLRVCVLQQLKQLHAPHLPFMRYTCQVPCKALSCTTPTTRHCPAAPTVYPCRLQDKSGGKVPLVNDGDFWLADSDKIVEWLEQQHPQPSMASSVPVDVTGSFFGAFRCVQLAVGVGLDQLPDHSHPTLHHDYRLTQPLGHSVFLACCCCSAAAALLLLLLLLLCCAPPALHSGVQS